MRIHGSAGKSLMITNGKVRSDWRGCHWQSRHMSFQGCGGPVTVPSLVMLVMLGAVQQEEAEEGDGGGGVIKKTNKVRRAVYTPRLTYKKQCEARPCMPTPNLASRVLSSAGIKPVYLLMSGAPFRRADYQHLE